MSTRRGFIRSLSLAGGTFLLPHLEGIRESLYKDGHVNWEEVRNQFSVVNWDKIHFNSGSAGVMPTSVRVYLGQLIDQVNAAAPYQVWNQWQEIKQSNLERLAHLTGSSQVELQVVRNTTEALNMIIYGLPLSPGDEILITGNAYPFAVNAWKNRAARLDIKIKEIELELPQPFDDILKVYQSHLTPKTKAVHITHMTHREGQIMPVRELCEMASNNGAYSIVDGAHIIGQIPVNLRELGCDFYASSLHKWLNAPHGTGLIYVKENRIAELLNHPSSNLNVQDSMDKYEHLGTRDWANEIALSEVLNFHDVIGQETKTKRLQELTRYWTSKVKDSPRVNIITDTRPDRSCAVATFTIEDLSGGQIVKKLDREFDIHAKSVAGPWGSGVRISVNIFTSFEELDRLVKAINQIS